MTERKQHTEAALRDALERVSRGFVFTPPLRSSSEQILADAIDELIWLRAWMEVARAALDTEPCRCDSP